MTFPFENDTDSAEKKLAKFYQGRLQAAVFDVNPELLAALSNDENIEITGLSLTMPLKEIRVGRDRLTVNCYDETAFQIYSNELTRRLWHIR